MSDQLAPWETEPARSDRRKRREYYASKKANAAEREAASSRGNVPRRNPENTGEPDAENLRVRIGGTGNDHALSLLLPQSLLEQGELGSVPPLSDFIRYPETLLKQEKVPCA